LIFVLHSSLQGTNNLVKGVDEDRNVLLLEDEHRPEADSVLAASTNINTDMAHGANEASRVLGIEGNERALVFSTEVLDMLWVFGSKTSKLSIKVSAHAGRLLDKLLVKDLLDDSLAHDDTGRVANPGVELTVSLIGDKHLVTKEVTSSLGLLGEGNHIWGRCQVPVIMSPEGTGGTETGLNLIGNENGSVLLGDITETLEESRGGVVVTTLRLNGLNNETGNGAMPCGHDALNFFKASLLLGSVLLDVLLKGVLKSREGGLGPVEARDVELVDSLGAGGREGAETTAVERVLEAHDGELRGARLGVLKAGINLLLVPVSVATLATTVEHESSLVGKLVGLRSRLSSKDVAEALGGDLHEAVTEDIDPLVGGKVANRRTVNESGDHLGGLGSLDQCVVVVSNGDGSNLGVDIEVLVAINIDDASKC
jgi:hypothetical protein